MTKIVIRKWRGAYDVIIKFPSCKSSECNLSNFERNSRKVFSLGNVSTVDQIRESIITSMISDYDRMQFASSFDEASKVSFIDYDMKQSWVYCMDTSNWKRTL